MSRRFVREASATEQPEGNGSARIREPIGLDSEIFLLRFVPRVPGRFLLFEVFPTTFSLA